jgi:endonuclease/exonuclease/phosphatase (EEP) superfamily protein YafD
VPSDDSDAVATARRSVPRRLWDEAALVVLAPLLCLWTVRVAHLDDRSGLLFAVQTLTPVLYVPAYAVLVVSLVRRRLVTAVLAAVVVVSHLAWTIPDLPLGPSRTHATGASLSLASANVAATNGSLTEMADALARLRTDVVVVEELTEAGREALRHSGFVDRYPHRIEDARPGFFGSAIYSRFPLEDARKISFSGFPAVRADVVLGDDRVALVAVHTLQPLAGLDVLRRQLDELTDLAEESTGPMIMAGDFNAGRQHRPFRALLGTRLRDAHLDRGRGTARTWPAKRGVPPFTLLDHVLVSEEWAVHGIGEFRVPGSDHHGVRADLQLRR